MLGNFVYCNPTKLYFGDNSLDCLNEELPKCGKNVVLVYGGGSIKKNGIYDAVTEILKSNGKNVAEIPGVMPNPTLEKLYEGVEIARKHGAEFILAVGGGPSAIIQKRFRFPFIAMRTRGKSIMFVLRNPIARFCR